MGGMYASRVGASLHRRRDRKVIHKSSELFRIQRIEEEEKKSAREVGRKTSDD